jgi:hypothetical protein
MAGRNRTRAKGRLLFDPLCILLATALARILRRFWPPCPALPATANACHHTEIGHEL